MTKHGNLYLKNGTQFFLDVYFMFFFFFQCSLTTFVIERKKPLKNHLDSSRPKGSQTVKRGRMSLAQENNSFQKG